ncbi:hypothetical protein Tco_0499839 [Tanacetum coccineum]
MAVHTERMERFEKNIFKQREDINGKMTEMIRLLKELTTSRAPEKVLIREEAKFPITKNVNSISLANKDEERSDERKETPKNTKKPTMTKIETPPKEVKTKDEAENRRKNKSIKILKNEEVVEAPGSQPITYYLKHKINEKLIMGLVDNNGFNNSLSGTRVGKKKKKAYNVLLGGGAIYKAILKNKITKKEDVGGNFEIPCSIGGLKHVNALVDQWSDVNIMPYSTYMKLTNERPTETDIRLSLASHSYIYPLGIAEDMLVEVAKLILEWEERIRLHQEKKMEFNRWRSKNFKDERPTLIGKEEGMENEGEVTFDKKKLGSLRKPAFVCIVVDMRMRCGVSGLRVGEERLLGCTLLWRVIVHEVVSEVLQEIDTALSDWGSHRVLVGVWGDGAEGRSGGGDG